MAQLPVLVPLMGVWIVGVLVLVVVAGHDESGQLLVDPAYASGGRWYFGFVSNLGILAWAVATVAAASSSWLTRIDGRPRASVFLRNAAIVSGILLLDDLFTFHATLAPKVFIPKNVAQLALAIMVVVWLLKDWSEIRRTRFVVLVAGLVANVVSLAVDVIVDPTMAEKALVFEDGPKFLGILAWATYFVLTSCDISRSVVSSWQFKLMTTTSKTIAPASPQLAAKVAQSREMPTTESTIDLPSQEPKPVQRKAKAPESIVEILERCGLLVGNGGPVAYD